MTAPRVPMIVAVLALLLAGCGGGGDGLPEVEAKPAEVQEPDRKPRFCQVNPEACR